MTITARDIKAWQTDKKFTAQLLADEDLTGDLLALALVILNQLRDKSGPGTNWLDRARIALGWEWWKVRGVLHRDAPHYRATDRRGEGCIAPMIRRDGPCGKRAGTTWQEIDPQTGEAELVSMCSRHSPTPLRSSESYRAWVANGKPRPPANTGGILARYFTKKGLAEAYEWAHPDYDRDGEGKPPTLPRPTLRLIRGEGE